jgi:uncharacterized protein (DUF302 family)
MKISTREISVRRLRVVSSKSFQDVVCGLSAAIGHPDMISFHGAIATAQTMVELEKVVHAAIGSSELIEFIRFDDGEVLRKERGGQQPRILRLVIGNPIIMKEMTKHVPDAAAYAPVTILVDERADGVHLSYDSMASLIAPYGSMAASEVARDLDKKIESLLTEVAADSWDQSHVKFHSTKNLIESERKHL